MTVNDEYQYPEEITTQVNGQNTIQVDKHTTQVNGLNTIQVDEGTIQVNGQNTIQVNWDTPQVESNTPHVNTQLTPQVEGNTPQVNTQLTPQVEGNTPHVNSQSTPQVKSREDMNFDILSYCVEPRSRREIAEMCGLRDVRYLSNQYLSPLLEKGFLQLTIPDKPRSSKQKYQTVIIRAENEKA